MTSAIVKAQIAHAKARAAVGDCTSAEQILNNAWLELGDYARGLAARGMSPADALRAHKMLARAHIAIRKLCLSPGLHGADAYDTVTWGALALGIFGAAVLATGLGGMRT